MISNAKARTELNFNPRPFSETIRDFLGWLKENGTIQ